MLRRSALYPTFDFDEASNLWLANKKRLPKGCYEYICIGQTKTGKPCRKKTEKYSDFCKCHSQVAIDSLN